MLKLYYNKLLCVQLCILLCALLAVLVQFVLCEVCLCVSLSRFPVSILGSEGDLTRSPLIRVLDDMDDITSLQSWSGIFN